MIVQSPAISSALRQALALDGGGSFPMVASGEIVPVAIVADVRPELTNERVSCWQGSYQAAVAAQYSWVQLRWPAGADPSLLQHAEVKRLLLRVGTATTAYIGLMADQGGAPGFQLPRRKDAALQSSPLSLAGSTGSTVVAPTTWMLTCGRIVALEANRDNVIDFHDPLIIPAPGYALGAIITTLNLDLYASYDWIEQRRA